MNKRIHLLAQIAEDSGPELDHTGGTLLTLENFEASEWLTATDAPKDAAIQLLLDGLCEMSGSDATRLNTLFVRLLCSPSFDDMGEIRDSLRSILIDGCKSEISRELKGYDVTELATLATVKRAGPEDSWLLKRQAG